MPDETLWRSLQQLIERNHADDKEDINDLKTQLRDLDRKIVSQELFLKFEREWERRFGDLGHAIADEKDERKADIKAVFERMDKTSTKWSANIWQTLTMVFLVVGTATTLLNAFRGA